MAVYTNSDRWSIAGTTGSLIVPELWLPELENDLPLLTFWNQFMVKSVSSVKGLGDTFHVSYVQDRTANTTALTAGTPIACTSSSGLGQADVTTAQYGGAEAIENLQAFLSNSDVRGMAAVQVARGAMIDRNALVGSVFTGGANYFTITGTTAASVEETSGTTAEGTSPLLPVHLRTLRNKLAAKGIPPFADGYYRFVYAPGQMESVFASAETYTPAASLGINTTFKDAMLPTMYGFVFIEEAGVGAICTTGTNGKSCIIGGGAVVGYDDFLRPDLVKWYADDQNDFGRSGKIGWTGLFGATLKFTDSTNARTWNVYSGI